MQPYRFRHVPHLKKLATPILVGTMAAGVLAAWLAIAVSSAYAVGPVSVLDPQAELSPSDAVASAWFGNAVATSGDTILVGDYLKTVTGHNGAGAVYAFTRSGGQWVQRAELTAPTPTAGEHFGQSVAIFGTTALIGDTYGSGRAYVFSGSAGSWKLQAQLAASDAAANDWFGYSVAVSGDTALVGAPNVDSAYVFTRSGTKWTQQAKLKVIGGYFGWSVALAGDTALVGAYQHPDPWSIPEGAAYVFGRSGTTWTGQATLSFTSMQDQYLGTSAALSADGCTALLGAPRTTVGTQVLAGAAYVFTRPDAGSASWSEQAELTDADATGGPEFGGSVALDGDTALVGDATGANASVFTGSGSSWTQQAELTNGGGTSTFGSSVALDGGTAVVGDYRQTVAGRQEDGAAYVYSVSSTASPVDSVAPTTAGVPALGQTLSCDGGTWMGTPTPTLTYQWLRNGQPIGGATAGTYIVKSADCGHQLACQVMAANAGGQAWANSNVLSVPTPTVGLKASSLAVRAGRTVTLSGSVKHSLAASRTVFIYRKVASKLTLLKKTTLSTSGGFRTVVKLKRKGSWVLLASYKAYGATFKSKAVTIRVLA